MKRWPEQPVVYEINAWPWLTQLERKYKAKFDLGSIPSKEWDDLNEECPDVVWLMGVWARSPAGTKISRENPELNREYRAFLPDFSEADVSGSPYCISRYAVEPRLGGRKGLAIARQELARVADELADIAVVEQKQEDDWVALVGTKN